MKQARELDLVLWGATGFTGALVARYLAEQYPDGQLRWALGGRTQEKLETLRASLPEAAQSLELIVGDSHDTDALKAIAKRTRVVCSTVGPYALYGSALVDACVAEGTDYCDLTGEPHWIRRMLDAHEAGAQTSGARIVHCCGFDSIPSDIGCWFINERMRELQDQPCSEVKLRVRKMRGGVSGGTVASLFNVISEAKADRSTARVMVHPYSLNPANAQTGPDNAEATGPSYDPDCNAWIAPFVMGAINTKIVRRSNAIAGYPYGENFRYSEAVTMGSGIKGWLRAVASCVGLGLVLMAARFEFARDLMTRHWLPKPGSGPSEKQRQAGFFNLQLIGKLDGNPAIKLTGTVRGKRDPGYGATSRMLAESAVCLAKDELNVGGGFWTPASAMAEPLARRLAKHADVTFTLD
jgi:short subunit dehydrogenase-like uncharacterized protein